MRWFDRAWATGALRDSDWARRTEDYRAHLEAIGDQLDTGCAVLAGEAFTLHDGQVTRWQYGDDGSLTLRVLTGDLQRGYEWTTLRYESAELIGAGPADLALWYDEDQLTEVGEEEVDLLPGGRFAHRLLLWPEGEFGVAFRRLEIDHQPASSADRH
jgi:hypothetical protein